MIKKFIEIWRFIEPLFHTIRQQCYIGAEKILNLLNLRSMLSHARSGLYCDLWHESEVQFFYLDVRVLFISCLAVLIIALWLIKAQIDTITEQRQTKEDTESYWYPQVAYSDFLSTHTRNRRFKSRQRCTVIGLSCDQTVRRVLVGIWLAVICCGQGLTGIDDDWRGDYKPWPGTTRWRRDQRNPHTQTLLVHSSAW